MTKTVYNVKETLKIAAEKAGVTQKAARELIDALDATVAELLKGADQEHDVEVKLLPSGVTVVSTYVEARQARNPLSGEMVDVPAKLRVKGKIGKAIKDAANA